MKRKVVKLGPSTAVISLPSKWTTRTNVKPGDEIEVTEEDNKLIIQTNAPKQKKETTIEVTKLAEQDLEPTLTHVYRHGFDIIKFQNCSKEAQERIQKHTSDLLLGFEVTKEGKETIIENIAEPTDEKFHVLLRRSFLIIKEMIELHKEGYTDIEKAIDFRKRQDKYILFCRRILLRQKKEAMAEWSLLTFLWHINHALFYFYQYCHKKKIKKTDSKLLTELEKYFELYYNAYYKKDIELVHEILLKKEEYHFGKIITLLEKGKKRS